MDIRIPTRWIVEIAKSLQEDPTKAQWQFDSLGNILAVTRVTGIKNQNGNDVDSLDFEYNPGD